MAEVGIDSCIALNRRHRGSPVNRLTSVKAEQPRSVQFPDDHGVTASETGRISAMCPNVSAFNRSVVVWPADKGGWNGLGRTDDNARTRLPDAGRCTRW